MAGSAGFRGRRKEVAPGAFRFRSVEQGKEQFPVFFLPPQETVPEILIIPGGPDGWKRFPEDVAEAEFFDPILPSAEDPPEGRGKGGVGVNAG